jgi:hypothetical protein
MLCLALDFAPHLTVKNSLSGRRTLWTASLSAGCIIPHNLANPWLPDHVAWRIIIASEESVLVSRTWDWFAEQRLAFAYITQSSLS